MDTAAYTFARLYPYPGAPAIPGGTVIIQDGFIRWLGPGEDCHRPAKFVGGTAYPGFIDSHVHFTATGLDLLALNAGEISRIPDLLDAIHQLDKSNRGLVRLWGFDPEDYPENRLPSLAELDKACPNNLLWINHIESHATLVNSRSLEALGLPLTDAFLVGHANQRARNYFLSRISREEREEAAWAAADLAISRGVTTVHAMEGGHLFHNDDIFALMALQDRLPVDTVIYPQVLDVDWVHGLDFKQVGGCLPLDGSSGVYTAALTRPYYNRTDRGLLYHSQEEITAMVRWAQERGMQVAMHACGDAAIDLFLAAVETGQKENPGIRHRIEHFELPRYDQVERCKELGVILSMQPAFDWFWGGPEGDYAYTMGPEGWQNANPVGWAIKAGLLVAGGSDSGVTPLDPLLGIHAALNHRNPKQRVNLVQALAMFTENGAAAARLDDRGRLEVGMRGDIVVLREDLQDLPPDRVKDTGVIATINRGELVYLRP